MKSFTFSVNGKNDAGTLTWNSNGTLSQLAVSDQITGTSDSQTCNFSYDDLTRISSANCGSLWSQNFTYDAFGNISKSGTGQFLPMYSATQNQFTSIPGVTVRYDANGNLLTDNLNNYTWDPNWGNMLTVGNLSGTVTATYDALGRMVEQQRGSSFTEILYSPVGKTALMSGQTVTKAFIYLPGGATAVYTSSGLAYYRHSDWLGSSRLASTQSRTLYSSSPYAPFGEQYANAGTVDASFTGQNMDTVNNLYDFTFREQSMSQGRWVSPDPAGLAASALGDPQTWNRYAYVGNLPLGMVDPLGLAGCEQMHGTSETGYYNTGDPCDTGTGSKDPKSHFGHEFGGGGGGGCDFQCRLQQALQAALSALSNLNCGNLIDGGTGAAAAFILGQMGSSISPEEAGMGGMNVGYESADSLTGASIQPGDHGAYHAGSRPGTITADAGNEHGSEFSNGNGGVSCCQAPYMITINDNLNGPFMAGYGNFQGLTDEQNGALTILHEIGHLLSDYGLPTGVGPDGDYIGGGQAGANASTDNSKNIAQTCFK